MQRRPHSRFCIHNWQAPRLVLGSPAPSRVCPRTSTGRPGVHVRSGGRLSRAATQLWFAQTSRVACGHSRDGPFIASLAQRTRAPVYEAGCRTFESFTRRQSCRRSQAVEGGGLQSRWRHAHLGSIPSVESMPRWTSGEVLGPSSRRGGFNSRTGHHCSTRSPSSSSRFDGRKPAATIGRRRNPSPTTFPSNIRV